MFYVNGQYVKEEDAKISVMDLGLVRGYGVFDYLRTYQGIPFHLHDHLSRLQFSAEFIGIKLPKSLEEIEEIVCKVIGKEKKDLSIKIVVTGGMSPDQLLPKDKPHLIVFRYPFQPLPQKFYTDGIKTITTPLLRSVPQSKTLQYIPAIMALQKGASVPVQEALYVNGKGEVLEATTSNFFAFRKGVLVTPESEELLHGITREVVLRIAEGLFPIAFQPIRYEELKECEEVFLTSSTKEVIPVSQIDDLIFPVGTKTKKLMQLFAEYTKRGSWETLAMNRYVQR